MAILKAFPVSKSEKCPLSGKWCEVENCALFDDDGGCLVGLHISRSTIEQKEITKQLSLIAMALQRIYSAMPEV